MFSPENGREIPWEHEEQIFLGLERLCSGSPALNRAAATWQMALCYHVGFGTSRNASSAFDYATTAKELGHPVAKVFSRLLAPQLNTSLSSQYQGDVADLLGESVKAMNATQLGRAYLGKDAAAVNELLRNNDESPILISGTDFNILHFLFLSEDLADLCLNNHSDRLLPLADTAANEPLIIHDQWPLHLIGSPLAMAISVKSFKSVQRLLELGANPSARAYAASKFPANDERAYWNPLHVAVKYHCSNVLALLLSHCRDVFPKTIVPYANALAFSTPLERLAMHGSRQKEELNKTIEVLRSHFDLNSHSTYGMTALMRAIDFQDDATIHGLLQAEPSLARKPFVNPFNKRELTFPVHYAAQLASRRDTLDAVHILEMISGFLDGGLADQKSTRDNQGRTPLHLSVTGSCCRATEWLLKRREELLHLEDSNGRTALHCCASSTNCALLLERGAVIDHADKEGLTALHMASLSGDVEIVRVLLQHKPTLDSVAANCGTALHCAVTKGSMDVAMALIEAGASIDQPDKSGNTSSHLAVRMARTSILRMLMRHGADLSICNSNLQTPQDLATSIGTFDVIPILELLGGKKHAVKSAVAYSIWTEEGFSEARDNPNDGSSIETQGHPNRHGGPEQSEGASPAPIENVLTRILFGDGTQGPQESDELIDLPVEVINRMGQVLDSETKATMITEYIVERCQEDIREGCHPETQPAEFIRKLARTVRLYNPDARVFKSSNDSKNKATLEDQPASDKLYVEAIVILVEELWKPVWMPGASRKSFGAAILKEAKAIQDQRSRQLAALLDEIKPRHIEESPEDLTNPVKVGPVERPWKVCLKHRIGLSIRLFPRSTGTGACPFCKD